MTRPKHIISFSVNGESWTFGKLPDRTYIKRYKSGSDAICLLDKREVWVRASSMSESVIAHELMHILVDQSNHSSSDLTSHQVEELTCEIVGRHYAAIPYMVAEISRLLR